MIKTEKQDMNYMSYKRKQSKILCNSQTQHLLSTYWVSDTIVKGKSHSPYVYYLMGHRGSRGGYSREKGGDGEGFTEVPAVIEEKKKLVARGEKYFIETDSDKV